MVIVEILSTCFSEDEGKALCSNKCCGHSIVVKAWGFLHRDVA